MRMTAWKLEIDRLAANEARAARLWYAKRSSAAADEFMAQLDHALAQVTSAPHRWPSYLFGTRAYRFRRFPYLLVYLLKGDTIRVISVAHGSRRPGY